MARIVTWCVLGACTGLAACLSNSSDSGSDLPAVFDPVAGVLDGAPPFGASAGVPVPMISADLNNVSNIDANIVFNADGSFTVTLPGRGPITVSDADSVSPRLTDDVLGTTVESFRVDAGTIWSVDVHLGEDAVGRDLFLLARVVDDAETIMPSPITYLVVGDETDTLPDGSATYNGGYYAEIFDRTDGTYLDEQTGTVDIQANFDAASVDVTLTETTEFGGADVYSATGLTLSGAQYEGAITGAGYTGTLIGAFYGANAEATAGAFGLEDATTEIIGGFAATQ